MSDGITKTCSKCQRELPTSAFGPRAASRDGYQHYCRACKTVWLLGSDYGITREQYDALLSFQNGRCAGCGVEPERWYVDHDHACCPTRARSRATKGCGQCIRALLCASCNRRDVLAGQPPVDWTQVMGVASLDTILAMVKKLDALLTAPLEGVR